MKAGRDELSTDQIHFGKMIRELGGVYVVARSVEKGLKSLKEAISGS